MKRCPKCSRTYPDETQKFCTIDGGLLLTEQPPFDPNLTIRATSKDLAPPPTISSEFSEAPTSMRLPAMDETITAVGTSTFKETPTAPSTPSSTPASSDLRPQDQTAPTSADLTPPNQVAPTVFDLVPPAATTLLPSQPGTAELPASGPVSQPLAIPLAPPKKKSMVPMVIGVVAILLLLVVGGAAAAGYFLWLKPRMEANRPPVLVERDTTNENANANKSANTNSETANVNSSDNTKSVADPKKGPEPFVPSAGDVQFANSKATLDGELADHYVDFSFYYPQTWTKDPKAGVPGATSFATVAREFSEKTADYIQERALVSWYPSNGTYDGDRSIFPERAKKVADQISKGLPGYEEVSRGETSVNFYQGYEFRFKGVFKNTGKGDLPYWGRVIFLPPGNADEKNGVTIVMLATSLAPGVTNAGDVGVKGELALILESFRFGAGR